MNKRTTTCLCVQPRVLYGCNRGSSGNIQVGGKVNCYIFLTFYLIIWKIILNFAARNCV